MTPPTPINDSGRAERSTSFVIHTQRGAWITKRTIRAKDNRARGCPGFRDRDRDRHRDQHRSHCWSLKACRYPTSRFDHASRVISSFRSRLLANDRNDRGSTRDTP